VLNDAELWGSGRIGSYEFRIDMLLQRDLLPLIFGSGPGSDELVIPVWWWNAKDAHSDLLHTLIETGLLGLLGVCIFLWALWKRLEPTSRPLLLSLLAGSAISNGLLARPTEFFLLVLAIAVAESRVAASGDSLRAAHNGLAPIWSVSRRP
jgi:O-antigen ligase